MDFLTKTQLKIELRLFLPIVIAFDYLKNDSYKTKKMNWISPVIFHVRSRKNRRIYYESRIYSNN